MRGITTILQKELKRVFQDKKLVMSLFVLPVVLIIAIYGIMFVMAKNASDDVAAHISKVYIQNAPEELMDVLNDNSYNGDVTQNVRDVTEVTDDSEIDSIKEQILTGDIDLLIIFPDNFKESVENYKEGDIPEIMTYYNPSEEYSAAAREEYVDYILENYREELLEQRVGDLSYITVFTVDSTNNAVIQDNDKASGKIIGMMLPYFITIMLFAGAMSMGVDMITGEKERGTMATMLLTPIKRSDIVLGKIFALMIFSLLSAATYIISMIAAMPLMGNSMGEGAGADLLKNVSLTLGQFGELAIILFGTVFLYVAIISLVSVIAKTSKEAQTYMSPVYIAVMFIGLITMMQTKDAKTIEYAIPVYNISVALKNIFTRDITTSQFVISAVTTYVYSGILAYFITRAFNSEKTMFNA